MGVYVNQAGYLLKGEKRAVLTSPSGRFFLEDEEGKEVYRGEVREFGFDRSSGESPFVFPSEETSMISCCMI